MTWYPNLPANQQNVQPRIDQFNVDEFLWRSLEPRRRRRREILRCLKEKEHHVIDLLEFSKLSRADNCIAQQM